MSESTGVKGEMTLVVHGMPVAAFPGGRVSIIGYPLNLEQTRDLITVLEQASLIAALPADNARGEGCGELPG